MRDRWGREIDYMRVSVTDRCNLRCRYCMPEGIRQVPVSEILTLEETVQICRIAAENGIRKIKVTGGEPLVRKGCVPFIGMLKQIPGIEQVTLTTNGVLLQEYAEPLLENGLYAVNISLDTLDRGKYREITGTDALPAVEGAIRDMLRRGVPVKLNAVLEKGTGKADWKALAEMTRETPLLVRFIEMMPLGYGKDRAGASGEEVKDWLETQFGPMEPDKARHGNGPAVYWKPQGFQGSIGFISALHGKFCRSCNRLRLTAQGELKSCLCYEAGVSLKEPLRRDDEAEVERRFREALWNKPEAHCFERPEEMTEKREMGKIGG
ncbi:GTP 3',8-cyclase MoaA [Candidatus Bariatricus faecipullorum]